MGHKKVLTIWLIVALMIFGIAFTAFAQDAQPQETPPEEESLETSEPLRPEPPDVKATVFLHMGIGYTDNRSSFHWQEKADKRPLHDELIESKGPGNTVGITGWFYPTQNKGLVLIADIAFGSSTSKTRFYGEDNFRVDDKLVSYSFAHLAGGLGYRYWYGKKQKYSATFYAQGGPRMAVMSIQDFTEDIPLSGFDIAAGTLVTYHYSTGILFGVGFEAGYADSFANDHEMGSSWVIPTDVVNVDVTSSFINFKMLIGYDF